MIIVEFIENMKYWCVMDEERDMNLVCLKVVYFQFCQSFCISVCSLIRTQYLKFRLDALGKCEARAK